MRGFMRAALTSLPLLLVLAGCNQTGEWSQPSVSEIENPAAPGARFPFPAVNSGAEAAVWSWLEPDSPSAAGAGADTMKLVWASYDGKNWSTPELITRGDGMFVNWADFPALAGTADAPLAAHWLQKIPGESYAYHVNMAFRSAAGVWSAPIVPHADRSATEHGFVSLVPIDGDRVLAIWLDGYQMQGDSTHESHDENADLSKAMTLRSTVVRRDGGPGEEVEVDSAVCDCCQTSAARSGNRIIVVYRNRSAGEIRDIYRAVYDLDEGIWSQPLALSDEGWEIAGCPVNGPQVAAMDDTVIAAWFTTVDEQPRSFMAVSNDGGLTFGEPEALDNGASIGRVGIAINRDGIALLTWISSTEVPAKVYGRLWRAPGLEQPFVIGEIDASRASGFPRVAPTGAGFLVAWTLTETRGWSEPGIKTVLVHPGE